MYEIILPNQENVANIDAVKHRTEHYKTAAQTAGLHTNDFWKQFYQRQT